METEGLQRQSQGVNVPAVVVPVLPAAVAKRVPEFREILEQQNLRGARTAQATTLNWLVPIDEEKVKKGDLQQA